MSDKTPHPVPGAPRPTIFADAVTEVVIAHGVARLSLGMAGPEGQMQNVATLCIPVMQLPTIASGLNSLLQQMQAKAREAQQAQARPAEGQAQANAAAADAAFRFSS